MIDEDVENDEMDENCENNRGTFNGLSIEMSIRLNDIARRVYAIESKVSKYNPYIEILRCVHPGLHEVWNLFDGHNVSIHQITFGINEHIDWIKNNIKNME